MVDSPPPPVWVPARWMATTLTDIEMALAKLENNIRDLQEKIEADSDEWVIEYVPEN